MASTFKWLAPEAIQTYFTTELNSLASGSQPGVGSAIDNETDLYQFLDIEINLASLTPVVGGFISIILVPTLDGTNYADSNINFLDRIVASMGLRNTTAAQRVMKENVAIPPLKFKFDLFQSAGVTLASSGNTFKYRRHNGQAV